MVQRPSEALRSKVRPAGKASMIWASEVEPGPLLVRVIVKIAVPPAGTLVSCAVFFTSMSALRCSTADVADLLLVRSESSRLPLTVATESTCVPDAGVELRIWIGGRLSPMASGPSVTHTMLRPSMVQSQPSPRARSGVADVCSIATRIGPGSVAGPLLRTATVVVQSSPASRSVGP